MESVFIGSKRIKTREKLLEAICENNLLEVIQGSKKRSSKNNSGFYGNLIDFYFAPSSGTKQCGDFQFVFGGHDLKSSHLDSLSVVDICSCTKKKSMEEAIKEAIDKVRDGLTLTIYDVETKEENDIAIHSGESIIENREYIRIYEVRQYIKIVEDEFKRYARVKSKNKDNWKVEILKSKLPLVYEKEIVKVLDND